MQFVDAAQRIVDVDDGTRARVSLNGVQDVGSRYVPVVIASDYIPLHNAIFLGYGLVVFAWDDSVWRTEEGQSILS